MRRHRHKFDGCAFAIAHLDKGKFRVANLENHSPYMLRESAEDLLFPVVTCRSGPLLRMAGPSSRSRTDACCTIGTNTTQITTATAATIVRNFHHPKSRAPQYIGNSRNWPKHDKNNTVWQRPQRKCGFFSHGEHQKSQRDKTA